MKYVLAVALLVTARAQAMDLVDAARQVAMRHGLEPTLVAAVVRAESGWNARAVSPKGALGLMQLMPATARDLGVEDPFDPIANLDGGCRYLRQMMARFGDLRLALAAYNAGPEAVSRAGDVPDYRETREYIENVLRAMGSQPARIRLARSQPPRSAVISLTPCGSGIVLLLEGSR